MLFLLLAHHFHLLHHTYLSTSLFRTANISFCDTYRMDAQRVSTIAVFTCLSVEDAVATREDVTRSDEIERLRYCDNTGKTRSMLSRPYGVNDNTCSLHDSRALIPIAWKENCPITLSVHLLIFIPPIITSSLSANTSIILPHPVVSPRLDLNICRYVWGPKPSIPGP